MKKVCAVLFLMLCLFYKSWGQVDAITADRLETLNSDYKFFRDLKFSNTVVYTGFMSRDGDFIKLRNKQQYFPWPGIVTTASEQYAESIQVLWGESTNKNYTLSVYYNELPYIPDKVFDVDGKCDWGYKLMEIGKNDSTVHVLPVGKYRYLAFRSESGVISLKGIRIKWEKMLSNMAFPDSIYEVEWGQAFSSPRLKTEGAVYSSSNKRVATVDPSTGEVKIAGCGMTTITAAYQETEKYQAGTASYTLMVHSSQKRAVAYDFVKSTSLFPEYSVGDYLPDEVFLVSGDAQVKITKGVKNPGIMTKEGTVGLRLSQGTTVEVSVPEGCKISDDVFSFWRMSAGTSSVVGKNMSLNRVVYKVLDPKGIHVGLLKFNYRGTYKLKVGQTGHVTFTGASAYVLPEGLEGGIVSVDERQRQVNVSYCVRPGDIVAARVPLILRGNPGEYFLLPTEEAGRDYGSADNRLRPVLTSEVISAPVGCRLYILAMKNRTLGFYWQTGSKEGDAVRDISHKAYLEMPVPSGGAVQGYRLNLGESTGVEEMKVPDAGTAAIYTLAGVRVNLPIDALPSGLYIIKGKKVYVK